MGKKQFITIERHILEQQKQFPQATGELTNLLYDLALCGKAIAREVNKAGLVDILGLSGEVNVHGEATQKLDEFANQVMIDFNDHTGRICCMVSEEQKDLIPINPDVKTGNYVLVFDPLDGSSNIDMNISIGTIFSIYRRRSTGDTGTLDDVLQPGHNLVAAGYILYGSSTMLVYSAGLGAHGFTLDPSVGEFLLSFPHIQTPEQGKFFSINESYTHYWGEGIKRYIEWLKTPDPETGRPYTARYVGSLVADFHRNLLAGGIFLYPPTIKTPDGKLRLLYEAIPLAYIADQAGGLATDGTTPILDRQPQSLHERTPLIVGSKNDVETVQNMISEYGLLPPE
jgi:fructose-1,6-bisphosphatase I